MGDEGKRKNAEHLCYAVGTKSLQTSRNHCYNLMPELFTPVEFRSHEEGLPCTVYSSLYLLPITVMQGLNLDTAEYLNST